jgi:adenosylcobinamide amidohydrolase
MRCDDERDLPALVWRLDAPMCVISSAPHGGGLGTASWILNATVPSDYSRTDPQAHVFEIASAAELRGDGTGMLTGVDVREARATHDNGVHVVATVGLSQPTWAAAPDDATELVGTINVVAFLPVAHSPAALVNAVATVTEAKAQALLDAGVPATGTATDAVVIACPVSDHPEPFGGPRSTWGARLARATHAAVLAGAG